MTRGFNLLGRLAWGAASAALLILGSLVACSRENATLYYFYEAVCPSCEESTRMVNLSYWVASAAKRSGRELVEVYDIFRGDGTKKLQEVAARHGVKWDSLPLPLLFADGKVYRGEEEIMAYLASLKG